MQERDSLTLQLIIEDLRLETFIIERKCLSYIKSLREKDD